VRASEDILVNVVGAKFEEREVFFVEMSNPVSGHLTKIQALALMLEDAQIYCILLTVFMYL
jgi:hypothetical protein